MWFMKPANLSFLILELFTKIGAGFTVAQASCCSRVLIFGG